LRFNTALYTGDVQERVKVLAETGQIPLAYMLAKTHGLIEFASTLEESIRTLDGVDAEKVLSEADTYARKGKTLLPLRPVFMQNDIFQSSEWPMTNMRAKEAERAAEMFAKRRAEPEISPDDAGFFDAQEYHSSNKHVANILSTNAQTESKPKVTAAATAAAVSNAKWGDDDDIDIDADFNDATGGATGEDFEDVKGVESNANEESDIFVPPSQGPDPLQVAVKKYPLVAPIHIAVGDFGKALELLKKQLALSNPEPLKHLFVDLHTLAKLKLQTLPHT
jgi:coatomer subunit alpha